MRVLSLNNLNKAIHEGFLIKTRNSKQNWQYNIIHSFYNDIIVIDVKDSLDHIQSLVGKNINISINLTDSEYLIEGTILEIDRSPSPIGKVKIISEKKFDNMRRYHRYLTNLGCNLKLPGEDIGVLSFINNLSLTGLGLTSNVELECRDKISLNIVTSSNTQLTLSGIIIWKNISGKKNIYGIAFDNNTPHNLSILEDYLNHLESLEKSIIKEWNNRKQTLSENTPLNLISLVVDDIKITRSCIKGIFESLGFSKIYEASNGNQAIQQALLYKPDIITLDISMPGIDGLEALKIIRNSNNKSSVIVISAYIDSEIKQALGLLGAKYFISKPFEQTQIIEAINKILKEDIL